MVRFCFRVVSCVVLGACVSDVGTKQVGAEGGPCFMDGTCKTGLVCVVPNMCVKPDAGLDGAVVSDAMPDTMIPTDAPPGVCATTGLIAWWRAENTTNDEQNHFPLMTV